MLKRNLTGVAAWLFILLFVYAAVNKLLDFELFEVQLSQSPIMVRYASWVRWSVPLAEIIIALGLSVPKCRIISLYAAFTLMVMFSSYILLILYAAPYVPCSCGGILSKLGWKQHLFFNLFFVLLAATTLLSHRVSNSNVTNNRR